jgi:pSer/pThr/pTyr-binding forkhead associated (FHA) protein
MTTQDDKPESGKSNARTQLRPAAGDWTLQQKAPGGKSVSVRGEIFVGREGCDLTLTSEHASRRHAKISLTGGVLQIQDLESANGTFVNGERVEAAELKPGDELRFDTEVYVVGGPKTPDAGQKKTALRATPRAESAGTQLRPAAGGWILRRKERVAGASDIVVQGEMSIGREGCDIALVGDGASRKHARLSAAADGLRVEDLGSANGTFVNGERVEAAPLKAGDELRFDTEAFVVGMPGPAIEQQEDDNKTALRPTPEQGQAEPAQPAQTEPLVPESAAEPAEEAGASAGEDASPDEQPEESERPVWYERETPNRTRKLDAGQMQDRFVQGGTQVVRGVEQVEAPSLIGVSDEWAGHLIKLDKDAMTIGRAGTDIVLDEPSVSTKHAQIVRDADRWKVIDLMSANGVYVNGKKTQVAFLSPGDAVRFGRLELRFVTDSTQVPSRASGGGDEASTSFSRKSGKSGLWLYFIIGFAVVLGIGAYLLFAK